MDTNRGVGSKAGELIKGQPLLCTRPLLNQEQYCCQFKIPFYCSNIYTVDTGIKGTTIFPTRTYSNETADPLQVMVDQCNEENDFGDAR